MNFVVKEAPLCFCGSQLVVAPFSLAEPSSEVGIDVWCLLGHPVGFFSVPLEAFERGAVPSVADLVKEGVEGLKPFVWRP